MKKFLLAAFVLLGTLPTQIPAEAENWIPFPSQNGFMVDTDSYVDSGLNVQISFKMPSENGFSDVQVEMDRTKRAYRILETKMYDTKGKMTHDYKYGDADNAWETIAPHSFAGNLYTHYVENPLPHFQNPNWKVIYTEPEGKYKGSSYQVETNQISYKDGYAFFWLRITYPSKEDNFSQAVYKVKMDVPHKRIQTLSMTQYDYAGNIKNHGAGSRQRDLIQDGTPMDKVHSYINKELLSGHLHMESRL